jgi:hypothetical protein
LQFPCPYIWLHIDSAAAAAEAYIGSVKSLVALLFGLMLSLGAHAQQPRVFTQAELDAMLAPVALYPDPLLTNILTAAIYPADVKAAADWSAANPGLAGDPALQAVEGEPWHPSAKALVAYPDVLARMAESPQWVVDLGAAYQNQYPALAASIQGLRARAQSTGALKSNEQQTVYQQNDDIYVQPAQPNVVYAPYYNPYVVYGTWWWPAVYPVVWRPWVARPVFVTHVVAPVRIVHPHRVWHPAHPEPVRLMPTPAPSHVVRQPVGLVKPMQPLPMPTPRAVSPRPVTVTPYQRVPESRRMPIVQSHTMDRSSRGGGGWHGGGHGGGRR